MALHRDDINENKRTVMITKSLDIKENTSFLKSPKSNAGIRELPIPDVLFELIEREVLSKKSGYLFTTKEGKLCTRSSFRKMWESIMKKTKQTAERLKKEEDLSRFGNQLDIGFTPHTFRHTYATNLYYAGIDLKRTQYLLGHSSLNMTLEVYTHMDYAMGNEITTEKINSFFGRKEKSYE